MKIWILHIDTPVLQLYSVHASEDLARRELHEYVRSNWDEEVLAHALNPDAFQFPEDPEVAIDRYFEVCIEDFYPLREVALDAGGWSYDIPTEPGEYWLYGWRDNRLIWMPARRWHVKITESAKGLNYYVESMYKQSGSLKGMWHKCFIPKVPLETIAREGLK